MMTVGLSPRLVYPMVLGQDWLDFAEVLDITNLENPWASVALEMNSPEGLT